MSTIIRATEQDFKPIADIGRVSVEEAHRASCPPEDMSEYINGHYNYDAIREELNNTKNIYHIIQHNDVPAGFSKIVFDSGHSLLAAKNITKLDRIYLLKEFHGLKLGYELMNFNIELARHNNQSAIWLFTWVGNTKAIDFYHKLGFKIAGLDKFKVSETHYNSQHLMVLEL